MEDIYLSYDFLGAGELDLAMEVMPERELSNDEWRLLITGPGQRFPDGAVKFQRALIKYFVQMGFEFVFLNNERTRVTAACMFRVEKWCFWRIHVVDDKADESFYISLYERNHTCETSFGTVSKKTINHQIVSDIIVEDIRSMPIFSPVQVQSIVKKNYRLDIRYCVAWKAMDMGRSIVFGDHTTSFSMLPMYFDELKQANPGSHVHLDVREECKFRRCFFAFEAYLLVFKHCRLMVMVDSTFLKGGHKGCLLTAVAKDGDEGMIALLFDFCRLVLQSWTNFYV